jgi:hypothetical protein
MLFKQELTIPAFILKGNYQHSYMNSYEVFFKNFVYLLEQEQAVYTRSKDGEKKRPPKKSLPYMNGIFFRGP